MSTVLEAVENAADSDNIRVTADWSSNRKAVSSRHREEAIKRLILRFLDDLPEDMTVLEIRRELEA